MAQDELVDAFAEEGKKILASHTERAQLRPFSACRPDFVGNANINREASDPIGFFLRENVRVLADAPGENGRSRPIRSNDKMGRAIRSAKAGISSREL